MSHFLDELDQLLLDRSDDGMLLSELDGFLTGVIVSPDLVPPSSWLKCVWGGAVPDFDDAEALQHFVDLVMRHYNELLASIGDPGGFEPIIDTDARNGDQLWELWVEGFAAAMKLAPSGWNRLRRSDDAGAKAALAGLIQLISLADGGTEAEESRWDREAPSVIPIWVQMLHEWRLENDPNRPSGKVGRNDPCSCGSGKKYKKCCGLN